MIIDQIVSFSVLKDTKHRLLLRIFDHFNCLLIFASALQMILQVLVMVQDGFNLNHERLLLVLQLFYKCVQPLNFL